MGTPYRPPSAGTAQTLILVGLIFQLLVAIGVIFLDGLAVAFAGAVGVFPIISLVFVIIGLLVLLLLYAAYLCYRRVRDGQYEQARGLLLVVAILNIIFFVGILSGILYLVAYIKLGDAVSEMRSPPQYMGAPPMGQPYGQPPMAQQPQWSQPPQAAPAAAPMAAAPAAAPAPQAAPVCPKCGQPATWIAQYGRYYCYTDSQYL